jgi:VanZ family protein
LPNLETDAANRSPNERASLVSTSLQVLTWCCVLLLAVLSLLPVQDMVRTGLPGRLEHVIACAWSAAIAMAAYGASRGLAHIIAGFWLYAGILEYLQHFSPGRHPALGDFAASAFGALCGVVAVVMVLVAAEEPGADGLSLNRSEPTKRAAKIPRKIVAGQQ